MKYIIYRIQINDYIYIGSTKNFTIRKSQHKRDCNNGKDLLVYRTIRENGGWDCCSMVPIREIDVETILQAHIVEEEERVKYNAQMNVRRAFQTNEQKKDYYRTDKRKEYARQYQQSDKYKEYERQRSQTDEYKEYQRQRNQTDERKEYRRQWYLAKKAEQSSQANV
jgi:hypothetical protein